MSTIQKSTFSFLKDIAKHNNREWFTENKQRYVDAKENTEAFGKALKEKLSLHDLIDQMKVFRIYKDVRFSKDKTPYKTNMGISFSRATAALRGGMYINIEPGNSFVGGGFWNPNSDDLKRIRYELSVNASEMRDILNDPTFKQHFGELKGDKVKTSPKGFDKNHPDIDLIRYKQFLISEEFTDAEVMSEDFIEKCDQCFKAMRPFFNFMSDVLTTNNNGESIL